MSRLKCKKCGAVYEFDYKILDSLVHLGPYKYLKCPSCGKNSFFNVYSSVKDPVTYPPQQNQVQKTVSEEEQEQKRIEESKYEKE
jgi:hypothetical protein